MISWKDESQIDLNDYDDEQYDVKGEIKQFINPLLQKDLKDDTP